MRLGLVWEVGKGEGLERKWSEEIVVVSGVRGSGNGNGWGFCLNSEGVEKWKWK